MSPYGYRVLNRIKVQVFLEKHIKNKHWYHPDKNYFYFYESNIPKLNLIVGSIKVLIVFTKYRQVFHVFLLLLNFSLNVDVILILFRRQVFKNEQFWRRLLVSGKLMSNCILYCVNVHRIIVRTWLKFTFYFLFINRTFKNSSSLNIKNL